MPTPPKGAKQPTDRQAKATGNTDCFTFTHDGAEYTLKPTYDVLTPGFLRKNRHRDDMDAFFTMLEELADPDALDAIDHMSRAEFHQLQQDFYEHLEVATAGE